MVDNQLTREQRLLVEQNHNLIYRFLHDNKLPIDDNYGTCAIALCTAARTYNPQKGAFSTYAYRAMRNLILREKNQQLCKKRQGHTVSLDALRSQEDGRTNDNFIPDKIDLDTTCITRIALSTALRKLSTREAIVLRLTLDGVSQMRIAEHLGCSHTVVWKTVKRYRDIIKAELS